MGYSPRGYKESDRTEWLTLSLSKYQCSIHCSIIYSSQDTEYSLNIYLQRDV